MKRHGGRKFILIPKNVRITSPQGKPDETMVKALARAWIWQKSLDSGKYTSIEELADKNDINPSYISRMLRLNLLAPDIKEAILNGTQPRTFNLQGMLTPFPKAGKSKRSVSDLRKPLLDFFKSESLTLQLLNLLATHSHVGSIKLVA
ncbi:MAG: hypothetical protein FJX22_01835 [Alphaproteobacteria bacterium]|nr:hypothetical protein [Alphaproteobacteria bacterium]